MRAKDDHLTTIGGDIVADHLEHTGYVNMAEFVRRLDKSVARANLRADAAQERALVLARLLDQMKPKEKPHDPRPPAEATD